MPWFQDKWEALSDRSRKMLEAVFGVIMAAGGWFFLRMSSGSGPNSIIWIVAAIGCVLLLPQIIETQTGGNRLHLMRRCMLIGLIVFLIINVAFALAAR